MKRTIFFLAAFFSISAALFAQDEQMNTGFIADIKAEMDYVQGQILKLADVIPEEKYSWRPSEGIRSISEVFMHVGEGNYFAVTFLGGSMPEGYTREVTTKVTKKSEVMDFVKGSYEYVYNILAKVNEAELTEPVDFFGNKSNRRRMLLLLLYHNHEHLGQAIAYSRINGIAPPWSMAGN